MTAQTVTMDGMTYGLDEMGQVKWATYSGEPDEPKPDIPPECWPRRHSMQSRPMRRWLLCAGGRDAPHR
jgi:hypothetical protein